MRQSPDVLQSWKEISEYMGRGVRTVQRWEKDFGLPVRRPAGHLRGSVLALSKELDEWIGTRKARRAEFEADVSELDVLKARHKDLCRGLAARAKEMRSAGRQMREGTRQLRIVSTATREKVRLLTQRLTAGRDTLRAAAS